MTIKYIKNREGDIIPFDISRIERAIEKAFESLGNFDKVLVDSIAMKVLSDMEAKLVAKEEKTLEIEIIQDLIEKRLMQEGLYEVAKNYIIYRNTRSEKREKTKEKIEKKFENKTLKIIKSDGKKEVFDIEKVRETYKRVSYQLARTCPFEALEESLKKYIVDDMHTSDMSKMMIKSALDLISVENVSWQIIAGRLALIDLYKQASKTRGIAIKDIYKSKSYKALFDEYIEK